MIKTFDEMFMPAKEAAQHEKKVEKNLSQLDAVIKAARECVNTQQFQNYKAKFEKEEKEMINVMIAYTNSFILNENANPAMYGMRMAMYVQKIYDLRRLLASAELDASRNPGGNNEQNK